ncbi:TrmH family RNA methyltransferase [Dokdonia sinensis]|uniref:TrmH family RNA methyltransferase n=1 Tax=Dokdonia sinensis TaxID=2479847 RepID=A0A3M0GD34_9FLAO|nr:TrmH family RNA methyltransferase [Dokdonia sinensis]RMB59493.1 TrmH family RNA methyltransferase [Dokdonia sinensis]
MADRQLSHTDHSKPHISKQIILMCDGVQSPANIGSLFRLGDAFGVDEIIFGGVQIDLSSNRLRRTARNTYEVVRFRESEYLTTTLTQLHSEGYSSIALEITQNSIPIDQIKTKPKKVVLIIGNERNGVSEELLKLSQHTAHIPMLGNNSSMNVAQAAAIAFYELRRK